VADPGCVWCGKPEAEHAEPSPVVGRPESLGRLCEGTTSQYFTMRPAMADEEYRRLSEEHRHNEALAGIMLVAAYREADRPNSYREMAEEHAAKAAELSRQMKAWRLAHGYDK
jgi:hypothetical protein